MKFSTDEQSERERALAALAMMKRLERARARRMRSERIDGRTVICSTPRRLKEIRERLDAPQREAYIPAAAMTAKQRKTEQCREVFYEYFGERKESSYSAIRVYLKERFSYSDKECRALFTNALRYKILVRSGTPSRYLYRLAPR